MGHLHCGNCIRLRCLKIALPWRSLHQDVQARQHEERQHGGAQHTADDRARQRRVRLAATEPDRHGNQREHRRERRHQDRSQAGLGGNATACALDSPSARRWEPVYDNKSKVLAIDGPETSRAYTFQEMRAKGDRVVINDMLDGAGLLVVYDAEHRMAVPYSRELAGRTLTFEGVTVP